MSKATKTVSRIVGVLWFVAWCYPLAGVMIFGEMSQKSFQICVFYFVAVLGWTINDIRDKLKDIKDGEIHQPKFHP